MTKTHIKRRSVVKPPAPRDADGKISLKMDWDIDVERLQLETFHEVCRAGGVYDHFFSQEAADKWDKMFPESIQVETFRPERRRDLAVMDRYKNLLVPPIANPKGFPNAQDAYWIVWYEFDQQRQEILGIHDSIGKVPEHIPSLYRELGLPPLERDPWNVYYKDADTINQGLYNEWNDRYKLIKGTLDDLRGVAYGVEDF